MEELYLRTLSTPISDNAGTTNENVNNNKHFDILAGYYRIDDFFALTVFAYLCS